MTTGKQIAANRLNAESIETARPYLRNALPATSAGGQGPRTPEGKAISSRNALRHGLLDKRFILGSECRDAYDAFAQTLYDEYRPATATEIALVDIMVTARWCLSTTPEPAALPGSPPVSLSLRRQRRRLRRKSQSTRNLQVEKGEK